MDTITLYILRTKPETHFYVGITKDLDKRLEQHKNNPNVSWVKRRNFKFDLVWREKFPDLKSARKKEKYYKKMERKRLLKIIGIKGV